MVGIPGSYAGNVGVPLAIAPELLDEGEVKRPSLGTAKVCCDRVQLLGRLAARGIEVHRAAEAA